MLTKNHVYRVFQIGIVLGISTAMLSVSGCTPLKKKFTRQKKVDKENDPKFIPVLNPVEYEERKVSAEENYKYHYSLWKVWNKDLLQTIERDAIISSVRGFMIR